MTKRTAAVLIAGFFTVSIAYAIRYGYGMLLPEMLPALVISKTQAGMIYGSYFLSYTICSPILGLLADRRNIRVILTVFTAILAGGAFLMAYATSVLSACLFFALAGIGHSACWAPVVSLVQRWVPDRRRGTALAFTTLGSGSGIALWGLILPVIVGRYDWTAGWMAMGVFGFCVAGLNGVLVRAPRTEGAPAPAGGREAPRHPPAAVSYWELLRERQLWRIGISYLFVGFTALVPFTYLSAYATEALKLDYAVATRLIVVIAMSGMIGKVVLGALSDSFGRVRTMVTCDSLMAAGCLGMAYAPHLALLYGSTALFGLGYGAVWPIYAAAAPDFFDRRSSGSVIGLWTMFLGIGSIFSPILCGWTIDRSGAYTWAFVLGAVFAGLSLLLLLPLLRRRPMPAVSLR